MPGWAVAMRVNARDGLVKGANEMEKIRIEQHSSIGLIWVAGWLFTIGYLKLGFWSSVLAIIIWPYDIGVKLAGAG